MKGNSVTIFPHSRSISRSTTHAPDRRISPISKIDRELKSSAQPGTFLPLRQFPSTGAGSRVHIFIKARVSLLLQPAVSRHVLSARDSPTGSCHLLMGPRAAASQKLQPRKEKQKRKSAAA
ncbi:hypothetical protein TIFTF001_000822 [Ficus carica]|uniref:Uncharacterized protein n=1 Tax=Ficus carica TaxID=3494 RepID=A0AA87Z4H2_FICCA|nr:hypothetical protein TIFTF001_000822 [Ficus carica]